MCVQLFTLQANPSQHQPIILNNNKASSVFIIYFHTRFIMAAHALGAGHIWALSGSRLAALQTGTVATVTAVTVRQEC